MKTKLKWHIKKNTHGTCICHCIALNWIGMTVFLSGQIRLSVFIVFQFHFLRHLKMSHNRGWKSEKKRCHFVEFLFEMGDDEGFFYLFAPVNSTIKWICFLCRGVFTLTQWLQESIWVTAINFFWVTTKTRTDINDKSTNL